MSDNRDLLFKDEKNDEIVSEWKDSPIPEFIGYFKRSIKYKGEYGFSWFQKEDHLFDYLFIYQDKDKQNTNVNHSYIELKYPNLVKYEFKEIKIHDKEYRLPIITFYPEIKKITLDILLKFDPLPLKAKGKEKKIFEETLKNTKLFLKTTNKKLSFTAPEINLANYYNLFFNAFVHNLKSVECIGQNHEIRIRCLNIDKGNIYIPNIELEINGTISEDTVIEIENNGEKIGAAIIKANKDMLELPLQFIIPYQKGDKEKSTELVMIDGRFKDSFGDIKTLLKQINDNCYCQALVRFKLVDSSNEIIYLELLKTEDDIIDRMKGEKQEKIDKKLELFQRANISNFNCDDQEIHSFLVDEYERLSLQGNPFVVFLLPYNYHSDKSSGSVVGGRGSIYTRVASTIKRNGVYSLKTIAHEIGHNLGLEHTDAEKEKEYNDSIEIAEKTKKAYEKIIDDSGFDKEFQSRNANAKDGESEIEYYRRCLKSLEEKKKSLTKSESKNLKIYQHNIAIYEGYKQKINVFQKRIEKLTSAKEIDKYNIDDPETLMHHTSSFEELYTIFPWQAEAIKKLNTEDGNE